MLASLYLFTHRLPARDLVARLRDVSAFQQSVLVGISELPNGCGVGIRLLAYTSAEIRGVFHLLWNEARLAILGIPTPDLRKG